MPADRLETGGGATNFNPVSPPPSPLSLVDWRRRIASLYAAVRAAGSAQRESACSAFRSAKDALFAGHHDSPLSPDQRGEFHGLRYYPYDARWRLEAAFQPAADRRSVETDLGPDGLLRYTRVGRVKFASPTGVGVLNVYWMEGYGGGVFLPFGDLTNGGQTFGGGRYLYDTIKGADPGLGEASLTLDFNYAYNPSCAYHSAWICPLAPAENRLAFPVTAGERRPD